MLKLVLTGGWVCLVFSLFSQIAWGLFFCFFLGLLFFLCELWCFFVFYGGFVFVVIGLLSVSMSTSDMVLYG